MKRFGALALLLLGMSGILGMTPAARAAELTWGKLTLGGNGCAGVEATLEWNGERTELRVQFPASFGLLGKKAGERVTCLLSMPVSAPPGKSLEWSSLAFLPGERLAPPGMRFSVQVAGHPPLAQTWEGEDLLGDQLSLSRSSQVVACCASGLLRLNLSLYAGKTLPQGYRIATGTFNFALKACK